MPLGFERLNERKQRPNPLVNFIKPLSGASSSLAQDFLERVAAISFPIMKAHHIAVMSLEEYPPNPEFVGRNFNAGEVIQLVLKSPGGTWLPFRHVQMVMMHELAHCKEMNHSRAFWKVRDAYAETLRGLWGKGYTGEGVWGRGRLLASGADLGDGVPDATFEPRSLCGGTFRSGGRKRRRKGGKEKPKLSYAERQQRRILRKFGAGGTALGVHEGARAGLEDGKRQKGKPRVAGSARGRELRAAAALARFERAKKETTKEEEQSGSEAESDYEDVDTSDEAAVDVDGKKMFDSKGQGLVKVCEGEDEHDENAQRELEELCEMGRISLRHTAPVLKVKNEPLEDGYPTTRVKKEITTDDSITEGEAFMPASKPPPRTPKSKQNLSIGRQANLSFAAAISTPRLATTTSPRCPICSLRNEPDAVTCAACSNVLDLQKLPNHWRCLSLACRGGAYVNAGDCGVCGVCGAEKPPVLG